MCGLECWDVTCDLMRQDVTRSVVWGVWCGVAGIYFSITVLQKRGRERGVELELSRNLKIS